VAIAVCVIACFSSHLSQGYHDLRISVDRKFKISKELKSTVSGIQVSEAPRKSLEAPGLESSEKIIGSSNLYRLNAQSRPKGS
jgi:L-lysine 2,3-aminomutase